MCVCVYIKILKNQNKKHETNQNKNWEKQFYIQEKYKNKYV